MSAFVAALSLGLSDADRSSSPDLRRVGSMSGLQPNKSLRHNKQGMRRLSFRPSLFFFFFLVIVISFLRLPSSHIVPQVLFIIPEMKKRKEYSPLYYLWCLKGFRPHSYLNINVLPYQILAGGRVVHKSSQETRRERIQDCWQRLYTLPELTRTPAPSSFH